MKPSIMMLAMTLLAFSGVCAGTQSAGGNYSWPYLIVSGRDSIYLYQPQGITWNQQQLSGSQAVSIRTVGESQERYGVLWFQANTNDAGNGKVTLSNFSVTKENFPSLTDNGAAFVQTITANAGSLPSVSQQKIQDDVSQGRNSNNGSAQSPGVVVKNDPPAVIHSNDPALLVMIDGTPKLTPVSGTSYQRIMNTNYLLLTDGTNNYYTPIGTQWAVTSDLNNPTWSITPNTDALNDAKSKVQADKTINITIPDSSADEVSTAAQNGTIPLLYIAERPTELLITNGAPDFTPIDGTNLLYAQNAKGDLFKSIDDNRTYTLLSGRWYSAPSIDGPWTWVDPSQLPADFAKIPQDHPEAKVLVSIPHTSQANEAIIANTVPQTATVDKTEASFNATYDGDPKFKAISNTSLEYAVNASAPVIKDGDQFYACDKAVWFEATAPFGPWSVATHVPDEIYAIPSNSPVYNVTYVKVYDEDNDDVTFGYTPGYFGVYDSYWGCPVYGTGWWYRPWIGNYWYGNPYTFGYGAGFGWSPYYGFGGAYFNFGFGFYSPIYRPWWGPWGGYRPYGFGYGFHGGVFVNRVNIYGAWGGRGVVVNRGPAFGAGVRITRTGGAGLYRPGTATRTTNGFSRGNVYNPGNRQINSTRGGTIASTRMNNGSTYRNTTTQNRMQTQGQARTAQTTQGQRTYQQAPRQQAQTRSYSAPAARSFSSGGGGGYRGGGGGGGYHGGGGGGGGRGGGRH